MLAEENTTPTNRAIRKSAYWMSAAAKLVWELMEAMISNREDFKSAIEKSALCSRASLKLQSWTIDRRNEASGMTASSKSAFLILLCQQIIRSEAIPGSIE
jgi:hypothetical protein